MIQIVVFIWVLHVLVARQGLIHAQVIHFEEIFNGIQTQSIDAFVQPEFDNILQENNETK